MIVCHIATVGGDARFSYHPDEEDLRTSLMEYYNEVFVQTYERRPIPSDWSLEDIIQEIEDLENVSWEVIPN